MGQFAGNPGDFTKKKTYYLKVFMVHLKQIWDYLIFNKHITFSSWFRITTEKFILLSGSNAFRAVEMIFFSDFFLTVVICGFFCY